MTPARHFPAEETLLAYVAGTLRPAEAAVVSAHVAMCPPSREWVRALTHVGGAIIDDLPEAKMQPDALSLALARIDADGGEAAFVPALNDMPELPEPLRHYALTPWRTIAPGTRLRYIDVPRDGGCRVFLLKIDPGRKMPQHTHAGIEMTCVLAGSFFDENGHYGPGDFGEADEEVNHRPVVDSDVPCICIVALDGQIKLPGPFGWLLQPFVRL